MLKNLAKLYIYTEKDVHDNTRLKKKDTQHCLVVLERGDFVSVHVYEHMNISVVRPGMVTM